MIITSFRGMTLDEYRKNYMTFQLLYAFHRTPFGKCLVAVTDVGEDVAYLAFVDDDGETDAVESLRAKWPLTRTSEDIGGSRTGPVVAKIFRPGDSSPLGLRSVRVLVKGTEFQIKVWRCLTGIPEGMVTTYEEVALMVGCKAAIAVGGAISRNHVAYVVPCHRVTAKDARPRARTRAKYAWGVERKRAILEYERKRLSVLN